MLRDYQQRTIDDLYAWFESGNQGHPCLVLPTGSGKSHIVAALTKDALHKWPQTRVLMLTHVKELIRQNAEKMRQHWPNAPMGIYSAGLRAKTLGEPITFAGIQSVRKKAALIGHIDLCIVDECHLISHKNEGGYRTLISDLLEINPNMRVVGLTATPFRLGHGLITDAPALFSDLIEPVTIEELIYKGHLAPLRSKVTDVKLSTEGVHKRGGEFIESELQAAVDTHETNADVVRSILTHAGPRKSWLVFCVGVDHAHNIRDELVQRGITAATVTGDTPSHERDQILNAFKAGQIQSVTNANVLTTGFDHPDLDLIVMLRPTMSASLYVQMAGRGMRVKSHTDHCLVLDYAGVVQTHGPITNVEPGRKAGEGGEMPVKVCENCDELVHISAKICPACGAPFPEPEPKPVTLHNLDIMGIEATEMNVSDWNWQIHIGRSSGKEMLKVTYYGDLSDPPITEYFTIFYDGPAGNKARNTVEKIRVAVGVDSPSDLKDAQHPITIKYRKDGKFHRVLERKWEYASVR